MHLKISIQQKYSLLLLSLIVIVYGCAIRYPLGLKEEQWQALTPQQQAEYTTKQYQIDEERRKRLEEYWQQKEREAAETTRLEKERIIIVRLNEMKKLFTTFFYSECGSG